MSRCQDPPWLTLALSSLAVAQHITHTIVSHVEMSRFQPPSARFTASSSSRPSTPQRQETATAPYTQQSAQQQPRRYQSQHEEEPLLRCQSCKQELPMHLLAEHDCRGGEPRRRPPETLRVDVTAATARGGYGASLSARSPMYSGAWLCGALAHALVRSELTLTVAQVIWRSRHLLRLALDLRHPRGTTMATSCRVRRRASRRPRRMAASFPSSSGTRTLSATRMATWQASERAGFPAAPLPTTWRLSRTLGGLPRLVRHRQGWQHLRPPLHRTPPISPPGSRPPPPTTLASAPTEPTMARQVGLPPPKPRFARTHAQHSKRQPHPYARRRRLGLARSL